MTAPVIVAKSWDLPYLNGARRSGNYQDTTPDAFAFVSQSGVPRSSVITSAPITVSGINAAATVTVSGGTWNKNGGAYGSAAGTAVNGDVIRVRHTSSGSFNTTVQTTLTVGGVSAIFASTTLLAAALTVGSGKQFATIQAALNAATPAAENNIIEVYNGTYAAFQSVANGTAAFPITLRAASGQTPIVTGFSTVASVQAHAHIHHPWQDWGEGIELRGTNDGLGSPGSPERAFNQNAINCVTRFKTRGHWLSGAHFQNSLAGQFRITGGDTELVGTLWNPATSTDAGEAIRPSDAHAGTAFINLSRFAQGGHGTFRACFKFLTVQRTFVNNLDWFTYTFKGSTGWGNHGAIFAESGTGGRAFVSDLISGAGGISADNGGSTPAQRIARDNLTLRRFFLYGNNAVSATGLQHISSPGTGDPGATNIRIAHATIFRHGGCAIDHLDNLGVSFGPFRYKNVIFRTVGTTTGNGQTFTIRLRYRSSRVATNKSNYWKTLLFMDGCQFDGNPQVVIQDADGAVALVSGTISSLASTYPANFSNITVNSNPSFTSQTVPPQSDTEAQAYARVQANFLPTNPVTARPLTTLSIAASGATTLNVADAQWFQPSGSMGLTDVVGDTVFIPGVGSRTITGANYTSNTITVNSAVTAPINTGVYLGSAIGRVGAV